jgi:hypothetical protein
MSIYTEHNKAIFESQADFYNYLVNPVIYNVSKGSFSPYMVDHDEGA